MCMIVLFTGLRFVFGFSYMGGRYIGYWDVWDFINLVMFLEFFYMQWFEMIGSSSIQ